MPTAVRRRPRLLIVSLATFAVVALVAAGCGGDDAADDSPGTTGDVAAGFDCPVGAHEDADGPVEVTIWHPYNALTQETLESVAADFNDSQDGVVVRVESQGTYEELLTKYETALGDPDTLPDVVFAEDTNTQFLIDSGSVMPAAACIDVDADAAEFYDDVIDSVTKAYTVQGALWPAAFGVSMPIMYVNDDHLRTAGLSTDDYPATLEELRSAAEELKAANIPGLDAPIALTNNAWFIENWLTGAGQEVVDNANGRDGLATTSEFDNERTVEILEWLHSMSEDGLLKTFSAAGGFDHYFSLARKNSSILIDGSRAITSVVSVIDSARSEIAGVDASELGDTDLQGLDVNVAPIAGLDEAGQGGVAGSAGWLVDLEKDDAAVAGAWEFFRFFNSKENQVRWTLEGSYLPVTVSAQEAPALVDAFEETRAGRWLATVYGQLQTLDPDFPGPVMGPYKEFRSGANTLMESIAQSGADPVSSLTEFDATFQGALEAYADEIGH